MTSIRIRFSGAAALLPVLLVASVPALAQSSGALARAVEAVLREERGLRRLEVEVSGTEVTLAGAVDTFWLKHAALQRTLDVPGVGTVVSEIAVPAAESDQRLAEEVGPCGARVSGNHCLGFRGSRRRSGRRDALRLGPRRSWTRRARYSSALPGCAASRISGAASSRCPPASRTLGSGRPSGAACSGACRSCGSRECARRRFGSWSATAP